MPEQERARQEEFVLRERTIGHILDETVARFPDREALVYPDRGYRLTWREFSDAVDELARGLMALGIEKGEKIGVWGANVPGWVILQFAAAKIGAILLTINTNYRLNELRHLLAHSECENIFLDVGLRDVNFVETLHAIAPELRRMDRGRLNSASLPHLRRVCHFGPEKRRGLYSMPEILGLSVLVSDEEYRARQTSLDPHDVINMQYTSGTTGHPKGALLTHAGIGQNAWWIGRNMRYSERDRLCLCVPFFHCFGCVLGSLVCASYGACMVVVERFSPLAVLRAVDRERCTVLYGVPTMFLAELEHKDFPKYDMSSLRTGVMAGSTCPEALMRRVMDEMNMREITICYGMTEVSPVMTQSHAFDDIEVRCGTVGRALPGVEVRVADPETCEERPRGQEGEVLCRGYNVMKGYWRMPEETARAITDGWMHSGDLGVMDERGLLRITGRIKDMIIRGGENLSPREVEELLLEMPDVLDAQVVGAPSRKYGEEPVAFIRARDGAAVTLDDVRAFCKGKIAWYKIPRRVATVDSWPLTATGKIRKVALRDMAAGLWPELMEPQQAPAIQGAKDAGK